MFFSWPSATVKRCGLGPTSCTSFCPASACTCKSATDCVCLSAAGLGQESCLAQSAGDSGGSGGRWQQAAVVACPASGAAGRPADRATSVPRGLALTVASPRALVAAPRAAGRAWPSVADICFNQLGRTARALADSDRGARGPESRLRALPRWQPAGRQLGGACMAPGAGCPLSQPTSKQFSTADGRLHDNSAYWPARPCAAAPWMSF